VVRNAAGSLAGSALEMATAVRNTVSFLGVRADFVLMDDFFEVQSTWIAGQADPVTARQS